MYIVIFHYDIPPLSYWLQLTDRNFILQGRFIKSFKDSSLKLYRTPGLTRGFLYTKRLPAWADSLCMVRISVCGLHELDDDHRSSIAAANAELEDTRVTALAVSVLACDLIEKLSYYIFISQLSDCLATSAEVTALCERDEVFSELAELFCLSFRRLNAAISEEGSENARQQRLAGCGVTS